MACHSEGINLKNWESILPKALHSVRSLLCTATNQTPHERFFRHPRRSATGQALPTWLMTADKVLLRRTNRTSKYEPLVDEVELVHVTPTYAKVRLPSGREPTVSLRHLAPIAPVDCAEAADLLPSEESQPATEIRPSLAEEPAGVAGPDAGDGFGPVEASVDSGTDVTVTEHSRPQRRSVRVRRMPQRLGEYDLS